MRAESGEREADGVAEPLRPLAVAFDVNETLTDLSPVSEVFARLGLSADDLRWWFAVLLRDGMALAAAGGSAGFADLAGEALDEVAAARGRDLGPGAAEEIIQAMGAVPVHPDVVPALDALAAAGVAAYALTNGGAAFARRILDAAGVAERLADVLSVDAVGHWKPRPEPYLWAAGVAGVEPGRMALVAVHPWDTHGASAAGLLSGWVNRARRPYPKLFTPPTVTGPDLVSVVERLVALDGT
ncbi:MAG: haloacid dehalogenase type II [Acidobacteriota bacterium]|nr:haloacid dehalogenase type II [Acidobacteriota bacterium]